MSFVSLFSVSQLPLFCVSSFCWITAPHTLIQAQLLFHTTPFTWVNSSSQWCMQVACFPMSLMMAAFEGSKVCQIYQGKGRGETPFDILPYSIWSFPGPRSLDVRKVKQQKKRVITIQFPCNTPSSLKDWRFRLLFQSQDWQIQQLFDNGTQKIYYGIRRNMLASWRFCELAPQERSHFICFQILLHLKSSSILQVGKYLWKLNEF